MTLFLASVRDPAEAELALGAGADIVDLKDPGHGALGALTPDAIAACVKHVAARAPISATIGDLPLKGDAVRAAVLETAALGVDYVKFGLFPGGDAERCLNRLKTAATRIRLVVVVFADALPNIDAIALAARIGAHGVMFDTMGKGAGSLTDHLSYMTLAGHIATAQSRRPGGRSRRLAESAARAEPARAGARSARLSRRAVSGRRPRPDARCREARGDPGADPGAAAHLS